MHYQDSDLLLSADKAVAEMAKDRSTLDGVHYQLLSARGNGARRKAERTDPDHTELTRRHVHDLRSRERRLADLRARDASSTTRTASAPRAACA